MKIFTVVYRHWRPGYSWFGRDSGLVTEGLISLGVESRLVILQTPNMPQDNRFLPACERDFLSPSFWRQFRLDGIVLQGGGESRTEPVAEAIRQAEIPLLFRLDTDGVFAPQIDSYLFTYNLWWWLAHHRKWPSLMRALGVTLLKYVFSDRLGPGRLVRRFSRSDILLAESRIACSRLKRMFVNFSQAESAKKIVHLPIPVRDELVYTTETQKEDIIVSVARWYDAQKDAPKLLRILAPVLRQNETYRAVIIGDGDEFVRHLVVRYAHDVSNRIQVTGRLKHEAILQYELPAKIFICSSRAESMNISSAEALCCGCSIVGPAEIASMHEYTSLRSGTMAWTRRDIDYIDAVNAEIKEWDSGNRDPQAISRYYRSILSPKSIAKELVHLVNSIRSKNSLAWHEDSLS